MVSNGLRAIYGQASGRPTSAPCRRGSPTGSTGSIAFAPNSTLRNRPASAPSGGRPAPCIAPDRGGASPGGSVEQAASPGSTLLGDFGQVGSTGNLLGSRGCRPSSAPSAGRRSSSMSSTLKAEAQVDVMFRMPRCFSSHCALSDAFRKNPKLFQGHRNVENFWPCEERDAGVTALQYQRRQLLLPNMEFVPRSTYTQTSRPRNDGWRPNKRSLKRSHEGFKSPDKEMSDAGATPLGMSQSMA